MVPAAVEQMSFLRLLSFYPAGQDQEGAVGQRGGLRLMGLRGGDCLEDQRVLEVEGVQRREVSEFKRGFLLPLRYVSRGYADLDVPTTVPGGPAAIPAAPVLSPLPHYCPGWPHCSPAAVIVAAAVDIAAALGLDHLSRPAARWHPH